MVFDAVLLAPIPWDQRVKLGMRFVSQAAAQGRKLLRHVVLTGESRTLLVAFPNVPPCFSKGCVSMTQQKPYHQGLYLLLSPPCLSSSDMD